jgi:Ceramidase
LRKSSAEPRSLPFWRELAVALLIIAPLGALFLAVPPVAQDPRYHAFADHRALLGIPSFANVISNAAFLIVGAAGLRLCLRGRVAGARRAWGLFFAGTCLVALGSGYYHWAPTDATLTWDRLPMTVALMALFVALVSEHTAPKIERNALVPAVLVGIGSVAWWRYTGDLRLYVWVQLAPLLAIPLVILVFRPRYSHRAYLAYGLLCYAAAKVVEFGDSCIYAMTRGVISGHTLKHLLAALAIYCVYLMLRSRAPVTPSCHPSHGGTGGPTYSRTAPANPER